MTQPALEITAEQAQVTAIAAYAQIVEQVRQRVIDFLTHLWRTMGSYHKSDVDTLTEQVVPVVLAGQRQVASLTDAYLSSLYGHMTGEPSPPSGDGLAAVAAYDVLREGKTPEDVYERPFIEVWAALKNGKSLDEAVQLGEQRLQNLAATDMQLAKTHASRAVLSGQERIVGYRRVLEGSYSCGLCILASTQRYHKEELMPLHNFCDCGTAPIFGNQDPGQVLNEQLVVDVHQAVADRLGKSNASGRLSQKGGKTLDYRQIVVTHQHGEIGPVMAIRGQHFDGPAQVK